MATAKLKPEDRSQINPNRADYLRIFAIIKLRHEKAILMRSVDFLWDLMSPREKTILLRILRTPEKMRHSLDIIDAGENLPPLFKDAAETNEGRNILAANLMLRIMRSEAPGKSAKHRNTFLGQLTAWLNFTIIERDFLYGLFLLETSPVSSSLFLKANSVAEFARFAAELLSLPNQEVQKLCVPTSKLMMAGLITSGSDILRLGEGIPDGFRGDLDINQYKSSKFSLDTGKTYKLESFDFPHASIRIAEALLKSEGGCNLLFYGKPGVGKTELARSLSRAANRETVLIEPLHEAQRENRLTRVKLAACLAHRAVIVVDEAEDILNTEINRQEPGGQNFPTKSVLNTFLDKNQAKILWIVNDYDGIHESTLRRFHFKIHFDALTLRQRTQVVDLILAKYDQKQLREKPFIENLIRDEFLTPGILDRVFESYTAARPFLPDLSAETVVPDLVASHKNRKQRKADISGRVEKYSSEVLNVEGNVETVIDTAKKFNRAQIKKSGGLNILLHGLPGTGKTEFVKHIAETCGSDLIVKRGSDLLSMFVGGTEERIAAAFREAERNKAILLIDEADTFFQARENAVRSWEISQTNEFLNQMENHAILLFCCTNFAAHFDHASMRRFHFKLEFKPMRTDRRTDFFIRFFDHLLLEKPQGEILAAELLGLPDLTPGDFQAVRKRYSFHEQNSISWRELVSELQKETKYKTNTTGRRIGF